MYKTLVANSTTMTMVGKNNFKVEMVGRYFVGITICFGDGARGDRL
jgi:hypothetical protein